MSMSKKLASPNDSIQQSTREPSQRSGELTTSLDATTFGSTRRHVAEVGGGPFKVYMLDQQERMRNEIEAITRKRELEQRRLSKLDKDLHSAEAEYDSKRHRYKLFQTSQDDHVQHKEAEVRQLEKRLIKAMADLNKGQAENEQLRDDINLLRRERELLNQVFRQLEGGIGGNKRIMERLKANINEERMVSEEKKQKMRVTGKMMDRERAQFHKETEKLKEQVLEISKAENAKGRPQMYKGKNKRSYMVADEEEAFQEQELHRRILKLSFLNTIQRRHIKQHQKNIEVFEQAFATIRSSTGISDIEEIVKIFIILEQRNFSLLTYVNQLNQDIEYVYKRNRELEVQMTNFKEEEKDAEARKENAVSLVSSQIAKTRASTREKVKQIKDAEAALEDCRPLVLNIVKFLKQEIPSLVRQAFEGEGPPPKTPAPDEHEENLNEYLMYIEDAIGQFKVSLPQEAKVWTQSTKAKSAKGIPDPPSAHIGGDDSDIDDPETGLGDRPWTRSELHDRAQAMIQRRRRKPGGGGKLPGHEDTSASLGGADSGAAGGGAAGRRDVAPQTAASAAAKEGDGGAAGGSGPSGASALAKSPSMSTRQASAGETGAKDAPQDDDGKAAHGDEKGRWWRQGKDQRR